MFSYTTFQFLSPVYGRVRTALVSDTQNPEVSNFRISTAHVYKYKTKRQAKMERRQKKMHTDHKRVKKIETRCCSLTQTRYSYAKKKVAQARLNEYRRRFCQVI